MMMRAIMTAVLTVCWIEATSADDLAWLDSYNVVWTSQSKNSGESMPVGGGDIGLNVWVENNELMFYLGRAGCRDENGALLKLGRVRINISPNPFTAGFRQELKLREGYVELSGKGETSGAIKVWVEVHRPIIHVEATTDQPVSIVSTYESWRTRDRVLRDRGGKHGERGMCMVTFSAYPGQVTLRKDAVETDDSSVLFYHRIPNKSFLFDFTVKQQKLEAAVDELWNPLENLTWGGMMTGDNFSSAGQSSGKYASTDFKGWTIKSDKPARRQHLKVVLHTDQTKTLDAWKQGLRNLVRDERSTKAWKNNLAWWRQFWGRSFIVVNLGANEKDAGWKVARNYNLFRYMLASNVHGREPTVFNGGVFTFDPKYVNGQEYTPDYRQWGASYHAQNQRLVYWPMLKSGDYDMMLPIFETYRKGLANARARVRLHWGHAGCCFTEAPGPLMLPGPAMYGFREGGGRGRPEKLEPGVQVNTAFTYIYQSQLEFAWMMLQYHRFSGLDIKPYLPMIKQSVVFYDEHYQYRRTRRNQPPLSPDGKLIISPSNALEGIPGVTNPAEAVAGLMRVLGELCALPEPLITAEERRQFKAMLARVPKLPVGEKDGKPYMRVAASREHAHPLSSELYPLFPYDLFGLRKPNLEIMQNTWDFLPGSAKGHVISWSQMPIHAARLGNAEYAKRLIQSKLGNGNKRFPAFFPVGHDWQPDHNWGGSGMVALQEMLMQTLDDSILLLPAWPKDWGADFKLHASRQTTVEGRVRNGKLLELRVTPESRKKDVVIAGAPPAKAAVTAAGHPAEGKIEPFLGQPKFGMQQVFPWPAAGAGERLPNVAVAVDGTVLATWGCNSLMVRRSEDGGKTWGEAITIAKPGWQGGGLTVDETTGHVLAFVETTHPPAPLTVYRSTDHGKTWKAQKTVVHPDGKGNVPSMSMNEHGITLRHGKHKGRLLRPSRWYAGKNEHARHPQHYTNAIYSDDGGKTWHTSEPFPAFGTGEATVAELSDGRAYYNTRRHWAPRGENPLRRWTAWSDDGGATWKDLSICQALPDGPQNTGYGCMGGLVRLPVRGRDILIYSNCDSPGGRHHGTVWASFDRAKTWPVKRLVFKGPFAYSSLNAGRPATKSEGWIYLHFEGGPKGVYTSTVARFNLNWVLKGEKTGNGELPKWLPSH